MWSWKFWGMRVSKIYMSCIHTWRKKSSNSVLPKSKSNEFDKISRVFLSVIVWGCHEHILMFFFSSFCRMWNNKSQLCLKFLRSEKFLFIYQMYFNLLLKVSCAALLGCHAMLLHDRKCTILHFWRFFERSKGLEVWVEVLTWNFD